MNFKEKVREQFTKAGWYEGRNIANENLKTKDFEKLPLFLQGFLNEYGNLKVNTALGDFSGLLDLTLYNEGNYLIEEFLNKAAWFGHYLTIFPIGHYREDNAMVACDISGRIYTDCDFPAHISDNLITGIEKVILEDYSDIRYWDEDVKEWSESPL